MNAIQVRLLRWFLEKLEEDMELFHGDTLDNLVEFLSDDIDQDFVNLCKALLKEKENAS